TPDVVRRIEIFVGAGREPIEHEVFLRTQRSAEWRLKWLGRFVRHSHLPPWPTRGARAFGPTALCKHSSRVAWHRRVRSSPPPRARRVSDSFRLNISLHSERATVSAR